MPDSLIGLIMWKKYGIHRPKRLQIEW